MAGLLALAAIALAGIALAHHALPVIDRTRTVSITGTVERYRYTNPHVWIDLDVTDPSATNSVDRWHVEAPPPSVVVMHGLKQDSLKVGDRVTVILWPNRDGSRGGSLKGLELSSGQKLSLAPEAVSKPDASQTSP